MKAKTISVYPKQETHDAIKEFAKKLRTSQAGLCEVALEFVLPLVQAGKMQLVNGRLEMVKDPESPAHAA